MGMEPAATFGRRGDGTPWTPHNLRRWRRRRRGSQTTISYKYGNSDLKTYLPQTQTQTHTQTQTQTQTDTDTHTKL